MIDQRKRRAICKRLLADDNHAQVDLASLYQRAGHFAMARLLLKVTRTQAKEHARIILETVPCKS